MKIYPSPYSDGMKRILQTKKDAAVDDGSGNPQNGMIVSGKVKFDELGRVTQQGQPNYESSSEAYVPYSDGLYPTYFAYDMLDRTIEVLTPDAKGSVLVGSIHYAQTTTTYWFGEFNGRLYAATTVVDPEGNWPAGTHSGTKTSYKDVDDRIVAVVERNWIMDPATNAKTPVQVVVTTYDYDPLGQITTVVDNKGNTTTVDYDDLGHRIAITNPDTGKTTYNYDGNGNLTSKFTAKNDRITYHYVFNRLMSIDYNSKTGSVAYSYGFMNEGYNRAGRIKKVVDESGEEVRFYGRLGETTREEKTVLAHTPAVRKKTFSTDYVFDSFGRMVDMTYPDGEKLHYSYDRGGLLNAAWGEKSGNRYNYITALVYDKFGQRTHITYGNGTRSTYKYNELTRRLATLDTTLKDGRQIQKLDYTYDLVGNVKILTNGIQVTTNTALPAGPVEQKFDYDDLYQLVGATGSYSFGPGKGNNYSSEFLYDTIGNFTRKKQVHEIVQPSTTKTFPKETNYTLNYVYDPQDKPHAVRDAGDKLYSYDANGNMTGWVHKQNGTRRNITWNEENRVKQIDDNGKSTYFLYDDAGERVVKRGEHGETIYANRFYSIRNGELGTKSVYAGETRVVSKLVKTPNTVTSNTTGTVVTGTTSTIPGIQGLDNGQGKKLGIIKRLTDGTTSGRVNPPVEKDEFYYHGDHLGSSNMITDAYGAVYQHLEYFPYGETWIEEGGSYGGNTPGYKFTGKELDPETGLYYYGARYYDPVLSRWISADPIFSAYLDGKVNGGIYLPINMGLFSYSANNPVKYVDPDGQKWYSKTDLTSEQLNSGKYLVVTMPLSKDTKLTLFTDDPNKDIKQSYVTTSAGTKRLEKVITDVSDPGTGLDRPTGISDPVVTSGVSEYRKHPVLGTTRPHHGMDISSKSKRSAGITGTEILAPAGGKVLRVGYQEKGAGKYVVISHGSGRESKFFHIKDASVKAGDYVLRGQNLGTVGKTGGISSGEHIHWEHRESGKVLDPNTRLKDPIPMRDN